MLPAPPTNPARPPSSPPPPPAPARSPPRSTPTPGRSRHPAQLPPRRAAARHGSLQQVPFVIIAAEPTASATSPTGFKFDLYAKNEGLTSSEGIASAEIKKAVVTLPQASPPTPSPKAEACGGRIQIHDGRDGTGCTEESKVGSVEVESPVVKQTVKAPSSSPTSTKTPSTTSSPSTSSCATPTTGHDQSALKVEPNPVTGQLTTTFDNLPQLPFSHFHLSLPPGPAQPADHPTRLWSPTPSQPTSPPGLTQTTPYREELLRINTGLEGQAAQTAASPLSSQAPSRHHQQRRRHLLPLLHPHLSPRLRTESPTSRSSCLPACRQALRHPRVL